MKRFLLFLIFPVLFHSSLKAQVACKSCTLSYPDNSNLPRSAVDFNESDVLRYWEPNASTCGISQTKQIRLWYNDEHALTLGVRQVIVKTSSGTTTTNYPFSFMPSSTAPSSVTNPQVGTTIASGDQSGNDVADGGGRPLWPALFITDITNNPTSRAGDWQQGGTGIAPTKVYGTWKGAVKTVDKTKSPATVTVTPDADPDKNDWDLAGGDAPPAGLKDEGYGAEVVWDLDALGLLPGHTYRLQFMVHDGDQNKTGGDVGEACSTIVMGGSIGDYVWNDANKNGKQDDGFSNGINGVKVKLYNAQNNTIVDSTVTANDGNGHPGFYSFTNVLDGCYYVVFPRTVNTSSGVGGLTGQNANTCTDNRSYPGTNGQTPIFCMNNSGSGTCDVNNVTVDAGYAPAQILAINLHNFNAQRSKQNVGLTWSTDNEQNNRGFYVQRLVADGSWENVAFVPSQAGGGNSNSSLSYFYSDVNNFKGVSQYRLQEVELTGKNAFSDIRAVKGEEQVATLLLFPNPSRDGKVNVIFDNQSIRDLKVFDITGRLIKEYKEVTNNNFTITDLKPGTYSIQVRDRTTGSIAVEKLLVN